MRDQDGSLEFHALPEPTATEVTSVAAATAARIERVLHAHGRDFDERSDSDDQLSLDYPALASCYRAATAGQQLLGDHPGQPPLRLRYPADAPLLQHRLPYAPSVPLERSSANSCGSQPCSPLIVEPTVADDLEDKVMSNVRLRACAFRGVRPPLAGTVGAPMKMRQ